jgi:hypothetical protein
MHDEGVMKTETTKRKISAACYAVIDKQSGKVLGSYGGRDGSKWAETATGKLLTEDSPVSVGVLVGLIVAEAGKGAQ